MNEGLAREAVFAAGFGALWERIDDLGGATVDELSGLSRANVLVLGALADHARELWMGERVRVLPPEVASREPCPTVGLVPGQMGLAFVREVAMVRLRTPATEHVRVDWQSAGMELVQAALLFGADEVVGRAITKAGLPLADGATQALRKADVAGLIKRAGRLPVFVSPSGKEREIEVPDALPAAHHAAKAVTLMGEDAEGSAP